MKKLLIYFISFLFILSILFFITFDKAQKYLDHSLKQTNIVLLDAFENYFRILKHSRWSAQNYDRILRSKGNNDPDVFKIIEMQMIQLSFGFDFEYFVLRSLSGKVLFEVKRGGGFEQNIKIFILGEEYFIQYKSATFMRGCEINGINYLCLVDIPNARDFIVPEERSYNVIALPIDSLLMHARNRMAYDSWLFPESTLSISLNNHDYKVAGKFDRPLFPKMTRRIDEGFYIIGGYDLIPMFLYLCLMALFTVFFVGIIVKIVGKYIQQRIKRNLKYEILNNKLWLYDELNKIVQGVVHDIKSPLATFNAVACLETDGEKRSLLSHASRRTEMIIQDLQMKGGYSQINSKSFLPLNKIVRQIYLEKSKEFGASYNLEISLPKNAIWIRGAYSEFCRVLSNLINNAKEASECGKRIWLEVKNENNNKILIIVKDEGVGISSKNLKNIFERGTSFGKNTGTGYGLYHAKTFISNIGGDIAIKSQENVGTSAIITLPKTEAPDWSINKLNLKGIKKLILIDDENVNRVIWNNKLDQYSMEVQYFQHPNDVPISMFTDRNTMVLIDNSYDSNHGVGLNFLESNNWLNCILLTRDWAISEIQENAKKLKIKLLEKDFIDQLEVVV